MHSHQSTKVWTNIRVLSQKEVHADVKLELPLTLGAPAAQTPVLVWDMSIHIRHIHNQTQPPPADSDIFHKCAA